MTVKIKRYDYLDILRMTAILLVVYLHSMDHMALLYNFDMNKGAYFIHGLMRAIGRIGVPVFFMVSGSLLLGKKINIFSFYKKRLPRIVFSIIAITVCYNLVCVFILGYPWQDGFFIKAFIKAIGGNPGYAYHLWFLYVTAGIYLAAPFFQIIVNSNAKHILLVYISISFCLGFVPRLTQAFCNLQLPYVSMDFFNPYLTYFIMGYCLHNNIIVFKNKTLLCGVGVICLFIPAFLLQFEFENIRGYTFIEKSEMLLWHDKAFVFITSVCFLSLVKSLVDDKFLNEKMMRFIRFISSSSYTIYLFHIIIIYFYKRFNVVDVMSFPTATLVLIFLCISMCCIINFCLKRIKIVRSIFC